MNHKKQLASRHRVRMTLSNNYGGSPAIPFSPSLLPSLWAWYDATKDTVVTDETILTVWTDRSGNARNLIDGTALNAHYMGPKYDVDAFGTGLPALRGWGTAGANDHSMLRRVETFPGQTTTYFVVKTATAGTTKGIMQTDLDGTNPVYTAPFFLIQDNSGTWRTLDNVTFRNIQVMTDNTKYVLRAVIDNVALTQKIYVNGALILSAALANSGDRGAYWFFSGYNGVWQGHISEIVISNIIDSGANQLLVEAYLAAKWGVY